MEFDFEAIAIKHAINTGSETLTGFDINVPKGNFHRENYLGMSAIAKCPRELFYLLNNVSDYEGITPLEPQQVGSNLPRIFRLGHLLEHEIISFMVNGGLEISGQQLAFSEFTRFRGHCDGIVKVENQSYLFDVKTMSQNSFDKFISGSPLSTSFKTYYQQLIMYMYYANLKSKAYIIAYCKNTSEVEVRPVLFDANLATEIRRKALNIVSAKSVLHIRCDRSKENCTFCVYKPLCNQVDEDLKQNNLNIWAQSLNSGAV